MRLDAKVDAIGTLSGWVLVTAMLSQSDRYPTSRLIIRRQNGTGESMEVPLPIAAGGRIHELLWLPDDAAELEWNFPGYERLGTPRLRIRGVGWVERTLRMANRVLRNWLRMSADERVTTGLTLQRALFDLAGAYRIATGLRGRMSYAEWIVRLDTLREEDRRAILAHIERLPVRPHFHLIIWAGHGAGNPAVTLASLREQLYQGYTCTVLEGAEASGEGLPLAVPGSESRVVSPDAVAVWLAEVNDALSKAQSDTWIMLLQAGDVLPAHALYWIAWAVISQPGAAVIYADDDALDESGARSDPRFKPDWSLTHQRAVHFIGRAAVLHGGAVARAGGIQAQCVRYGNFDLLLRVVDAIGNQGAGKVVHVPAVLLHRGDQAGRVDGERMEQYDESSWELNAVRAHLARNRLHAEVSEMRTGCRRIRFRLPEKPPLVSIIVPTRDAVQLLRQCVQGLLRNTTYPKYEILVVDNQSRDPGALAYLSDIGNHPAVRVLRYDRAFNFSAINNFAVGETRGEVICLLNNDTEVMSPDWLEEMVGHLLQPRVGVVGAKLYFPDGSVQHAGDTVGPGGCANHLHAHIARDAPGYCNRAMVAQELSAVTAACMLTWRELYLRLGGLDEKRLRVAFNDVDYCLRVRAAGYGVVWTPHAELMHHESVSRGGDESWCRRIRARHEVMTMRRRWRAVMWSDPFYNPNLSYQQPDFSLSRAPRVRKPWRSG